MALRPRGRLAVRMKETYTGSIQTHRNRSAAVTTKSEPYPQVKVWFHISQAKTSHGRTPVPSVGPAAYHYSFPKAVPFMSVEDREEVSSPNSGCEPNILSQIQPYTVITNSDSLEDGEIVEGHFSSVAPRPLLQQPKDPSQLILSTQVRTSTPPFPTTELVSLVPTVEPSNVLSLS